MSPALRIHTFLFLAILANWGLTSCEDQSVEIPGYVSIDSIQFETDYPTQGSSKYTYPDSWVYVDNDYLGTYENPQLFPVLPAGPHKISVRAGILENGIDATRSPYKKLATYDTLVNLEANQTVNIHPRVTYFSNLVFLQREDFDDGGVSLVSTNTDNAPLQLTYQGDTNAFEGASGKVLLTENQPYFEVASDVAYPIPATASPYIEMNYKGDTEFNVGLFITTASGSVLQNSLINVRASSYWKKIFINLRDLGSITASALNYKIYIRSVLPSGSVGAQLYFDNIKVLY